MTGSFDFWLFVLFLAVLVLFLWFFSSRYSDKFRLKIVSFFEKCKLQRLKNKERKTAERFKSRIKNLVYISAENEVMYLNDLMDKNEMFLHLGSDRYFDFEIVWENSESFSLIIFRPYTKGSLDIDALPEIDRIIESRLRIVFNPLSLCYYLGSDEEAQCVKEPVLEVALMSAVLIFREYIIKSYHLNRINQLV